MTARNKGAIATVIFTAALLLFYYSYQIINADKTVFGMWGDGYKNYYTLDYFLKYDTGSHFTGMNYPYGENVVFTDNQPAVAWILKCFTHFWPALTNHIHAYLIWSIFSSILISAFFLYSILFDLGVSNIFAVIFATFIALLSPQLPRLNAHFSLGYTCYLPILLWLLIKYFKTGGRTLYAVLLFALITFFAFVHIYFLGLAVFFILPLALIFWLSNIKAQRKYAGFIIKLALSAILPFLILKAYLALTDPITDRPQNPWGYAAYYSTPADIFLHPYSFTGEVLSEILPPNVLVYHGEGMGYIGVTTVLLLSAALIILLVNIRRAKSLLAGFYPLNYFIIPAVLVLMFAMAIPLGWPSFANVYNHMPMALKQLRASGRFNWIFYYVATVTASVIAYRIFLYLEAKRKYLGYGFIVLVSAIWFIDMNMVANRYELDFKKNSGTINEMADGDLFFEKLKAAGSSTSRFQAIITFPFFLNGSEKIYMESGSSADAMEHSLFTGLPIAHGTMSRTSLSQTFKIANLLSGELIHKSILADYKNNKPLLLIVLDGPLKPAEKNLVAKARFLFNRDSKTYYELPLSAFNDTIAQAKAYIAANRQSFIKHTGYQSADSVENAVVKSFENEPVSYAIFGKGALVGKSNSTELFSGTLPNAKDSTAYELSVWLYADPRVASFPDIFYTQTGTEGQTIESNHSTGSAATNNYGQWVRVHINFTLYNAKNTLYITGSSPFATYDELMIRPVNENVLVNWPADSLFSFNNYPLR